MSKDLEDICRVLGEPNRLRIVEFLINGERCVCRINQYLQLSQNLISHHLAVMKEYKILNSRREGKWIYYSINKKSFKILSKFIKQIYVGKNS